MVLATDRQRVLYKARELWREGYRTLDTETTGLSYGDEIVQWAVADQYGIVLGSGYCKPTVEISEGAFGKHGITMEQLADAPTFAEAWESSLRELLTGQTLVIYNEEFDTRMIRSSLWPYSTEDERVWKSSYCAMNMFAVIYGSLHEYHMTYTWQSLETAMYYFKIDVPGPAHDARHDSSATALLIKAMAELADKELPQDWHPPIKVKCYGKCNNVVKEFWEETPWYCTECGLRLGIYHNCPKCDRVEKTHATGIYLDDLCRWCHEKLMQEKMLSMKLYHLCPGKTHHYQRPVVKTPDPSDLCHDCQEQRRYREFIKEEERKRQEKLAAERKEYRRTYAKDYRQRKKEEKRINEERVAQGLPPLEKPTRPDPDVPFEHHGHLFQRERMEGGKSRVICARCNGFWVSPPRTWCNKLPTYWDWARIPEHLKTQTQLKKVHLKLAPEQRHEAYMENSYNRYQLYDQNKCIPTKSKAAN